MKRAKALTVIAIKMLTVRRVRLAMTQLGLMASIFLALVQLGILDGWYTTITGNIASASADLWLMAPNTPVFEYGGPISRRNIDRCKSVENVISADGLFAGWGMWYLPDGTFKGIHLIGIDEGNAGGPRVMEQGDIARVHTPNAVVVDRIYADRLGVSKLGQDFRIYDRTAEVRGMSYGVRTFTAAPYVFTSIKNALRFDKRYAEDEVTYVLVRVAAGCNIEQVRRDIQSAAPNVEVLTAAEFASRTAGYWLIETGAGMTLVLTVVLSVLVAGATLVQTLFAVTHENLHHYAMLLALGFQRREATAIVLLQGFMLLLCGGGSAAGLWLYVSGLSKVATLPISANLTVSLAVSAALLVTFCVGTFLALRPIYALKVTSVFRV